MTPFYADGHLCDEALDALIRESPLEELTRLEIAEHLAYCDRCLARYTGRLAAVPLSAPETGCQSALRRRIRRVPGRWAAAAAAVALALTMLWSGVRFPAALEGRSPWQETAASLSGTMEDLSRDWNGSWEQIFSGFTDLWDGTGPHTTQGGIHS